MIYERFSEENIDAHELVRVRHFNTATHQYEPIRYESKYTRMVVEDSEPFYTIRHLPDYNADGSWFYSGYEDGNDVYYEVTLQDEWTRDTYNKCRILPAYKFIMKDPFKRDTLVTFGFLLLLLCFGLVALIYYMLNISIFAEEVSLQTDLEHLKTFFMICGGWCIAILCCPVAYKALILKGMKDQDKFNQLVKDYYEQARKDAIEHSEGENYDT